MTTKILVFVAMLGVLSCKNASVNGTVSPDVVNNPATASDEETDPSKMAVFTPAEESYDFGKITQGEKVMHIFKFKNTGKGDLIVSNAIASCGCTVPEYPKDPIKADAESEIKVEFNSEGKEGKVTKTITVLTNANPSTKVLTIKAEIIVPTK